MAMNNDLKKANEEQNTLVERTPAFRARESEELKAANKNLAARRFISTFLRYLVLIVVGLIMIYPLVWMVGATFKNNSEIFSSMNPIPIKSTFDGYKNAMKSVAGSINIWKAMLNTYSYVIPEVIFTVISSVLTAYGFARFKFKGRNILFALMMAMLFVRRIQL